MTEEFDTSDGGDQLARVRGDVMRRIDLLREELAALQISVATLARDVRGQALVYDLIVEVREQLAVLREQLARFREALP